MNEEDVAVYDSCTALWKRITEEIEVASEKLALKNTRLKMTTHGAKSRFFRALLTSLKARDLCAAAQQALDSGNSVVIGLQSTGEGPLSAAGAGDDDFEIDDDDDDLGGGRNGGKGGGGAGSTTRSS